MSRSSKGGWSVTLGGPFPVWSPGWAARDRPLPPGSTSVGGGPGRPYGPFALRRRLISKVMAARVAVAANVTFSLSRGLRKRSVVVVFQGFLGGVELGEEDGAFLGVV